jgi:glycosyltransferase involved in cell wall biosynthesis
MKQLVIVADQRQSAIATSSQEWSKILNAKILYANEYLGTYSLVKAINNLNPDAILFSWRGALLDTIENKKCVYFINKNLNQCRILFSVPDHLGLDKFYDSEKKLISFADAYLVVSEELFKSYSKKFVTNTPLSIIHDLPDKELIKLVQDENNYKESNVIWVGNSKWGKRLGFKDHKGYQRYVVPFKRLLSKKFPSFNLVIIDRAKKYVPNLETLRQISKSKYLLQFSESEGTGLPILEACALGTIPISRRVGIINELFKGGLDNLVIENEKDAMQLIQNFENSLSKLNLKMIYNEYISQSTKNISRVRIHSVEIKTTNRIVSKNSRIKILSRKFKWIIRYLLK